MEICEHILNWILPLAFLAAILISGSIAYYWAKGKFTSQDKRELFFDKVFWFFLRLTVASAVAYGVILLMLFILNSPIPSVSSLGAVGDFVGGVIGTLVACMGAVYIVKTYMRQQEQSALQTFEKHCVTMLDFHRQNVQDVEIKEDDKLKNKGRNAFVDIVEEYEKLYDNVEKNIRDLVEADQQKYPSLTDENEKKILAHQLSYGYFFYGIDGYKLQTQDSELLDLYNKVKERTKGNDGKKCNYHIILGHYYRHIYNMIKYIDAAKIDDDKKEIYIQIIRALLSDYEQKMLYYNSMSKLGEPWNKANEKNMCFMAKYRLLKNCPAIENFHGVSPLITYAREIKEYAHKGEKFFDHLNNI